MFKDYSADYKWKLRLASSSSSLISTTVLAHRSGHMIGIHYAAAWLMLLPRSDAMSYKVWHCDIEQDPCCHSIPKIYDHFDDL